MNGKTLIFNLIPILYILACWIELALSAGSPAIWNLFGRLLLIVVG